MERVDTLSERILKRLEQHKHSLADEQRQLGTRMRELLDQRERLTIVAKRKMEKVIVPRMEEPPWHDTLIMQRLRSCIRMQSVIALAYLPIHSVFLRPLGLASLCYPVTPPHRTL